MSERFRKPARIDYRPLDQTEARVPRDLPEDDPRVRADRQASERDSRRASELVARLDRTGEFLGWLKGLLDDRFQTLAVRIDPEDDPQVYAAMTQIFDNPDPVLQYGSYAAVLEALDEIDAIEAREANPEFALEDAFIAGLPGVRIPEDASTPAMDVPDEDILAFAEAIRERTFGNPASSSTETKRTIYPSWARRFIRRYVRK